MLVGDNPTGDVPCRRNILRTGPVSRETKPFECKSAKKRVLDAFLSGHKYLGMATFNAVLVTVIHCTVAKGQSYVKMAVLVMTALKKY
ncbi:hypothetical protein F443_21521 [Phytophthora nicotianae P1569]|uniref:Uncharacterized protein n=1 Tax=Phytophthora nicotianae P1569 TaxID=1317065 RepID=V9DZ00_PHYNI|nr:hypothetical protein F443_21521 [Phytophthora nicotianae P1569]